MSPRPRRRSTGWWTAPGPGGLTGGAAVLWLDTAGLPPLLVRRLVLRALAELGAAAPRGPAALDRLLAALAAGRTATLGGVKARGGALWRFEMAPPRRQIDANPGQNEPKSG